MDTAYDELRRQAAAKRDKIIQNAQQEYRVAVRRINALRKLVTGESKPAIRPPRRAKDRSLSDMLVELLPKDRPFTVAEVCDMVYADPLGCQYKENSIRSQLPTLAARGIIHKIGRALDTSSGRLPLRPSLSVRSAQCRWQRLPRA